jgi:hypothetical protein
MALRFGRTTVGGWKVPVEVWPKPRGGGKPQSERVTMFPSTHDVTVLNAGVCRNLIERILFEGDKVLLVTKADSLALRAALDGMRDWRDRIEVRVTIGSVDDKVLRFWEPGAPTFEERVKALMWVKAAGFKTSVSVEPMLDGEPDAILGGIGPFRFATEGFWIGKARNLVQRVTMNTGGDAEKIEAARKLEALWTDEKVVKLWREWRDEKSVKWKDSIVEVLEWCAVAGTCGMCKAERWG